jgi:hypothetical protein
VQIIEWFYGGQTMQHTCSCPAPSLWSLVAMVLGSEVNKEENKVTMQKICTH